MPESETARLIFEGLLAAIAVISLGALLSRRRRVANPADGGKRSETPRQAPDEEEHERFRAFAGLASDWLYETDAALRLTWLSDSFSERSAVPADEIVGTRLWDHNVGGLDDRESVRIQRELMERREPFRDFVYSLTTIDGKTHWRRSNGVPRYDPAGRFLGYRGATSDITDQIATERNFRRLMEDLPDGIFIQRNGIIEYVNARLVAMMGGDSAADFVGKDSLVLFHPDDHEDVRARRALLRNSGSADHAERQHLVRRDGTPFYAEGTGTRIDWQGGPAVLVVLRDISERVAAEEARIVSEERYRLLAELMPEAFLIQSGGEIVYANAAARDLFGNPRGNDIAGMGGLDLVAGESRDMILERRNRVLETGVSQGPDLGRHVRGNGETFETESIVGPMEWDGRPATINIISDVSDRIATERVRAESEARFRDFAQATSDWFWEVDAEWRFNWFSFDRHPVQDVDAAALIGKHPWDITRVDIATSSAWSSLIGSYLDNRLSFRDIVVEGYRPDGSVYYLSLSGTPRFDEDSGTFLGYRGSTSDVTQQRMLENQLQQALKMDAIGQLTGGIAHDFNNLLAIVSGNLELMLENAGDGSPDAQFILPALNAAARGADLTRYLLAFARQQPLSPRSVDVIGLIAGMTEPLRRALGAQIELETVVPEGSWQAYVDPAQTETAILNLALNARDAMPDGGKLTIETANAVLDDEYSAGPDDIAPGNYLMVSVSDEGSGIPPEIIDRIFDPFVTTKEVGRGSGLGLSMVYGFVKQSHGHVRVQSEIGRGTTFKLYLPRADRPTQGSAVTDRSSDIPQGNGETVLVVEDDPDVLNLVDILLANLNYRTVRASTGQEALDTLNGNERPDLILTDVILPGGMTGVDVAKEAAKTGPGIPVIFMSGYTENSINHHGVLEDGVLLLNKPFRKSDLANMLRRALDGAGTSGDA